MSQTLNNDKAFLGAGWWYPVSFTERGELALAAGEEDIRQSIRIILGVNPGERVMRPDFGAGLRDFVFEPASPGTLHRIEARVKEALIEWEPRVDVTEVSVTLDGAEKSRILIAIAYRVRSSNSLANLVYPFYLVEGTRK